jgi:hypothetical protein
MYLNKIICLIIRDIRKLKSKQNYNKLWKIILNLTQ